MLFLISIRELNLEDAEEVILEKAIYVRTPLSTLLNQGNSREKHESMSRIKTQFINYEIYVEKLAGIVRKYKTAFPDRFTQLFKLTQHIQSNMYFSFLIVF